MDLLFEQAWQELLEFEGGYNNDPYDQGGKTKYGITEKVARSCGYQGAIKNLTKQEAKDIYYQYYWTNHNYDQIRVADLAVELFEQAVNLGPRRANLNMQHSYNLLGNSKLVEDGIVGVQTLAAVNSFSDLDSLLILLNLLQGRKYINICEQNPEQKRFLRGWLKRVSL